MIIHKEYFIESTVSGTFSVNTEASIRGIMRQFIISPLSDANEYNLNIIDDNDMDVFCESSITGHFAPEVAIPIRGVVTVTVSSSTLDESFTIKMMVEE